MIDVPLKSIAIPKDEFLRHCFETNIKHGFRYGLSEQGVFSEALSHLNSFCSMVSHYDFYKIDNVNFNLRSSSFKFNNYKYEKIFAIDQSGLSHGFLCGPAALEDHEINFNDRNRQGLRSVEYFGHDPRKEFQKYVFQYDVVSGWQHSAFGNIHSVTPELIREKIGLLFPNRKDKFSSDYRDLLKSSNLKDRREFGDLIFQTSERSFYLPIVELLKQHMSVDDANLGFTVSTNLNADPATGEYKGKPSYFGFLASYHWRQGKYNCSRYWKGSISFESFELLSMEISQEKEYDD